MSMKGETQAVHLSHIMQKHKLYPEYELVFPLVKAKRTVLKKLTQGDVLLLGLEQLALVLLSEGKVCANVVIHEGNNSLKIKIISLEENSIETNDSKKYEVLKCSFGMLQSRKLEVGHKIDIASLNLEKVKLFIETENRAEGILVKVDNEIAIEITKVNKNGK
jgi:hypothetical protein